MFSGCPVASSWRTGRHPWPSPSTASCRATTASASAACGWGFATAPGRRPVGREGDPAPTTPRKTGRTDVLDLRHFTRGEIEQAHLVACALCDPPLRRSDSSFVGEMAKASQRESSEKDTAPPRSPTGNRCSVSLGRAPHHQLAVSVTGASR